MVRTVLCCLSELTPHFNMRRHWLKLAIVFCSISLIGLSLFGVHAYRLFYSPMTIDEQRSVIVNIDKSMSAHSFAHMLKVKNIIQSERLFLMFIRTQGLSKQLKAGVYQIHAGESVQQLLYRVVAGDVLKQSFSIIEGMTQAQISVGLEHAPNLIYRAADWQVISSGFSSAEGLLLADTYNYNAGSQSKHLLELAHANLQQYLQRSWQQRSAGLPYKTPYEMLIAASILEKEASIPREKRLIAGVIINRLRKNMPLQMDPTVIYALGSQYTGKLTREDLHVDSPYNSYRYRGLPPTPIAMVGKDAIDAAAHPELTEYLYFVAVGDGSHYFSVTYEQQKQAVARYQKNR